MRVFGWNREPGQPWRYGYSALDKPWTTPYPSVNGFIVRLQGGDVCDPGGWVLKPGVPDGTPTTWFNANPTRITRWTLRRAVLPFISFKLGRFWDVSGVEVLRRGQPSVPDLASTRARL